MVDAMSYCEQILQPIYYDNKMAEERYEEIEEIFKGTTGYGL